MNRKIVFFDTTLRDGEQSPGVSLNVQEKVAIAKQLEKLNVDYIEAGFPIASKGDFEGVKAIAEAIKNVGVCGLARANEKDIDCCYEAIKAAPKRRIHTFIATSPIHMQHKLKMTEAEVLEQVTKAVSHAKSLVEDVEFSAEDAFRSELPFLIEVFKRAIAAGATTLNIPDTVGYATPEEFGRFIKAIHDAVGDQAILSVHCHNDLGLAVANSLQAIQNGATQIECTINGIGERAGNASLEEIAMALETRKSVFKVTHDLQIKEIYKSSRLVSDLSGMTVQPNKAIVGKNAFLHESGIHQDGVLKERETYEIMKPEDIGIHGNNIFLGKHSGRHAFRDYIEKWGYHLPEEQFQNAFQEFKHLCDTKKDILDDDIMEIVIGQLTGGQTKFNFNKLQLVTGDQLTSMATVTISRGEAVEERAGIGHGPVDAIITAINSFLDYNPKLVDYQIQSITKGRDAQGLVHVKVSNEGKIYSGRGLSINILESSAKAYIDAINKIERYQEIGGESNGDDNHRENISCACQESSC
ncbi:MAG: 2-isopropylmalate synthase [Clostridia bacterium]|nr:2-isopropylmalate synthase [Clostridia bacterium]